MESIEQELAATRMFRNLSPEQIEAIAELGDEVEFADEPRVDDRGRPGDIYFLIRDQLRGPQDPDTDQNSDDRTLAQQRPRRLVLAV